MDLLVLQSSQSKSLKQFKYKFHNVSLTLDSTLIIMSSLSEIVNPVNVVIFLYKLAGLLPVLADLGYKFGVKFVVRLGSKPITISSKPIMVVP
jgi:hypothetical protein